MIIIFVSFTHHLMHPSTLYTLLLAALRLQSVDATLS